MPLPRLLVLVSVMVGVAFLAAQALASVRIEYTLAAVFMLAVFIFVFVRADAGLYLVLFSMLLSPEFALGGGGWAEGRAVVVRLEDLLLFAIALSWLARMAVNKELGVAVRTPLNRWIVLYVLVNALATLLGYATGTVKTAAGFFYVLKYIEYFVVFYMTVNNLRDRTQARRLVVAAFAVALLVSLIAAAQIPSGDRVTAPFEGETGEPNTLGGYLLLMMALAAGVAVETPRLRVRGLALGALGVMAVPFLFTLSRASYLAVLPAIATLVALSRRQRRVVVGALAALLVLTPLVLPRLVPSPVARRVLYTFEPERGQPTVRLGGVAFDPSTSERLLAFKAALEGWIRRPILGYGVTGFKFMDAQYARVLVEVGIVGFAVFLGLLGAVFRTGLGALRTLSDPEDRGLALGFLAGTVALCVHAIGANTFIIVRIMEPFWFFAGVVVLLPALRPGPAAAPLQQPVGLLRAPA